MEGVCKYYEIAAFEDYYRVGVVTMSQNSCYYIMGFELLSSCRSNSFQKKSSDKYSGQQ